jgi:DNA polymerase-3 subunit epsilon
VLPVISANERELQAHDGVLADIDKASKGKTVWRQLEPAAAST